MSDARIKSIPVVSALFTSPIQLERHPTSGRR